MMAASTAKSDEKTRERIKEELLQRQGADTEALAVVMELLEGGVSEGRLISAARRLNPQYYRDVTEERGLAMCCGYPICNNSLRALNHRQKYHISTHTNKVYDVTERKYFCSPACYKASKYLESQLSDEPLWYRGDNIHCPIQLLKTSVDTGKDESVIIDATTVHVDLKSDPFEELSSEILQKLTVEGDVEPGETILDVDELSDHNSTDDEVIEPAKDLLQSRKNQRLNVTTEKTTGQDKSTSHGSKGSAVGAEVWKGGMLTQVKPADPLSAGRGGCITLSTDDSIALSRRHDAKLNKLSADPILGTSGAAERLTSHDDRKKQFPDWLLKKTSLTSKTILLDEAIPNLAESGSDPNRPREVGCLQACIDRLSVWFTDESRQLLVTDVTSTRSAEESITPAIAPPSAVNGAGSSTTAEDDCALPADSDEVEVTPPNIESVLTKQRSIVYHRIHKSLERLGAVMGGSTELRDRLGAVIKTFRLDRENIVARPLEWNVITLLLNACVYHRDVAAIESISQELSKLTGEQEVYDLLLTFITDQQKPA